MTKSDLKTGMRVETREGKVYMVLKDCKTLLDGNQNILFCNKGSFLVGSDYDEKLFDVYGDREQDIVGIYQSSSYAHYCNGNTLDFDKPYHCIWKRDDKKDSLVRRVEELESEIQGVKSSAILTDFIKDDTSFSKRISKLKSNIKTLKNDIELAT